MSEQKEQVCSKIGTNSGHGHVWERPDGMKVRCGGAGLCKQCSQDFAAVSACHQPAKQGECTCTVDQTTGWTDDKTFTPRCNVCGLIVGAVVRERAAQGEGEHG